jgi:enoyl-CoA hydratase/carnithine racemase
MKEYERDPNVKSIVLKGAGDKAFCAGGDIRGMITTPLQHTEFVHSLFFSPLLIQNFILSLSLSQ